MFGQLGRLGSGFGRLGASGRGGGAAVPGPGAPTIAVVFPVTNPPSFTLGLVSGSGAPFDTVVGDILQIGIDSAVVQYQSDAIGVPDIIAGQVTIPNGILMAGSHTVYGRVKRPGGTDLYSSWAVSSTWTQPLVITSSDTFNAAENQTSVGTISANSTGTYAITGGADSAQFAIELSTGVLTFLAAPDYEIPGDVGADNIYNVQVTFTRTSTGDTVSQNITVTVTDAPDTYTANAVNFDGANDWLTRDAGFTGGADSKLLTFSFWLRKQGGDGNNEYVFFASSTLAGASHRASIAKITTNAIQIRNSPFGTDQLLIATSSGALEVADGWVHVMGSVDMSDTSKRHLYVNDVSDLIVTTYNNTNLVWTSADYAIGAAANASSKLSGDIADFWLAPGVYIDLSVQANRRKFISALGKPVDLGTTGNLPTGSSPLVFLSGATPGWHTNDGTGGGFTLHGALTTATSPS